LILLQKVITFDITPFKLPADVAIDKINDDSSLADFLQFEVVELELRRVHLPHVVDGLRNFLFCFDHQQIDGINSDKLTEVGLY